MPESLRNARDELAKVISAQLEKQVGRAPGSVKCPDDLKGEAGATTRCTLDDAAHFGRFAALLPALGAWLPLVRQHQQCGDQEAERTDERARIGQQRVLGDTGGGDEGAEC
jgi:Domain of unknown function (DUF4333)